MKDVEDLNNILKSLMVKWLLQWRAETKFLVKNKKTIKIYISYSYYTKKAN